MKIINLLIILLFFYSTNSFSVEKDCSTIDKLSKEYAKWIADLAKEKGKKVKEAAKKKSKEVSGIIGSAGFERRWGELCFGQYF